MESSLRRGDIRFSSTARRANVVADQRGKSVKAHGCFVLRIARPAVAYLFAILARELREMGFDQQHLMLPFRGRGFGEHGDLQG